MAKSIKIRIEFQPKKSHIGVIEAELNGTTEIGRKYASENHYGYDTSDISGVLKDILDQMKSQGVIEIEEKNKLDNEDV